MARPADFTVEVVAEGDTPDAVVSIVGGNVVTATPADQGDVVAVGPDGSLVLQPASAPGAHAAAHRTGSTDPVQLTQAQVDNLPADLSTLAAATAAVAAGAVNDGDAAGGDLTGTYPSPTVAADAITNAKAANMAEGTIKGRALGAGTGDPTDLSDVQAAAIVSPQLPAARGGLTVTGLFVDAAVIDVQEFTTAGTHTNGWTKPANTTASSMTFIYLQQGGGGGGSGAKGAEGVDRAAGDGGTAGSVLEVAVLTSTLAATETVVVGAGGAGGTAISANTTAGNPGSNGGATTFDAYSVSSNNAGAPGSNGGVAIQNVTQGTYGAALGFQASTRYVGLGGQGRSISGLTSVAGGQGFSGGGGGGAYRTAANGYPLITVAVGGTGIGGAAGTSGSSGTPAGGAGGTSPTGQLGGGGGGGGYGAGAGGAGGWPGGGGGGGGIGINSSTNSGAGGAGSHGYARIVTVR